LWIQEEAEHNVSGTCLTRYCVQVKVLLVTQSRTGTTVSEKKAEKNNNNIILIFVERSSVTLRLSN
jgi:hypothetical protein